MQYGLFNSSFGLGVIGGSLLLGVWGGFKNKMVTSMIGVFGIGVGILALIRSLLMTPSAMGP